MTDDESIPEPPELPAPDKTHPLYELHARVIEALYAVPRYFASETVIEGIEAQDLFSLNSVLGSTIEVQVVKALNLMRDTWDPPVPGSSSGPLRDFGFVRMAQSYPDVRLQRDTESDPEVKFGIELKGWYLLSKEREPSSRFKATPLAASEWDLLVVVPWYLSNVLSGSPVILKPFVRPARWAAEYRNWYWEFKRGNPNARPSETRGVRTPAGVTTPPPYTTKKEMSDVPIEDGGGNYGRFSRAGFMDEYIEDLLRTRISGIVADDWVKFFRAFAESGTREDVREGLEALAAAHAAKREQNDAASRLLDLVRDMLATVDAIDEADEVDEDAAVVAALEQHRAELGDLAAAAQTVGLSEKEVAKLAGTTESNVKKALAARAEQDEATP